MRPTGISPLVITALVGFGSVARAQSGPGGARLGSPEVETSSVTATATVTPEITHAPALPPARPAAPPAAPEMPSMPKPPSAEAPPDAPAEIDAGWQLYGDAFLHSLMERNAQARRTLDQLRAEHPDHPATRMANELLARVDAESSTARDETRYGSLQPSGLARAELATAQTVYGIVAGAWLCGLAECDDARVWVSVLSVGGGAGLAASLLLTREHGITPGRALAINTGTAWGVYNGAMLAGITEPDGAGVFGALLGGQILGTAAGIIAARNTNPTAGDVSMVTSGGLWTGSLMFFLNGIADFDLFDGKGDLASILVMSDLGLVGAALLRGNDVLRMSRSRALLIDVGGIMGALLGMGAGVLVQGDNATPAGVFGPGLLGMLAGLTGTFYLTRDWDGPDVDVNLSVLPTVDGGLTVGVGGRF